ncbi:zeta toxin family protein [Streptomyces sp. VTCC 41912]|uniref:zeta toxin family protein n=1 Tax=Streptomyces sp. VTCC 41912 TaxID=3383243 RepID=UPI003896CE1C
MTDPSEFYLTEEQLEERFEQRVKEFVFSGYEPQAQPVLVLLGGQPAAGKSQAMAATQQRHADRHLVPLTGDELRPFHPRYAELLEADAQTRETATAQASGAWVRMSIDHALNEGHSLVLEGVFRDPAMTLGTAERFAQHDVQVEVVALAVREERSRLDAVSRFLEGGRWTPPELQNLAYSKVPETVAAAEASPAVQRVVITNRTGADLYVSERGPDGNLLREPGAVQALEEERARPFPAGEAEQWLDLRTSVVVEMAARGEVNDASRPVLHSLARDAEAIAPMADPDPDSSVRLRHEAAEPVLAVLADHDVASLPMQMRGDEQLLNSPEGQQEQQRRVELSPQARGEEDRIREAFAAARERHEQRTGAPEADRTAQPDGTAAERGSSYEAAVEAINSNRSLTIEETLAFMKGQEERLAEAPPHQREHLDRLDDKALPLVHPDAIDEHFKHAPRRDVAPPVREEPTQAAPRVSADRDQPSHVADADGRSAGVQSKLDTLRSTLQGRAAATPAERDDQGNSGAAGRGKPAASREKETGPSPQRERDEKRQQDQDRGQER